MRGVYQRVAAVAFVIRALAGRVAVISASAGQNDSHLRLVVQT